MVAEAALKQEDPLPHECDKEQLIKLTIDGQTAIFKELKDINQTLRTVAVQQNEIQHLRKDVDEIKEVCNWRHETPSEPPQAEEQPSLAKRAGEIVVLTIAGSAALAVFWLFAYVGFINVRGFLDFQQNPVAEKQGGKDAKSEKTHP